jgi:hypothetical protein
VTAGLEELDMRATVGAPAAPLPMNWRSVAPGICIVTIVALSVALAVSFGRGQPSADGTSSIVRSHLGAGYPAHGGLAGPSRVGVSAGPSIGYPAHDGLAGPSQIDEER